MNVGSLFSGVGGFDVGLERAGMRVVWQCEADPFCQRVLAKHWPDIACYPDVSQLRGADVAQVDVLCGGFPCQDISGAGHRVGIGGARSGLWSEYARLIGELRPRYVIVENVADLLVRGFGRVLGDLATLGYDAEWDCIPARAVGAPHLRDRVWLVAYPGRDGCDGRERWALGHERPTRAGLVDAGEQRSTGGSARGRCDRAPHGPHQNARHEAVDVANPESERRGALWTAHPETGADVGLVDAGWWEIEPGVGRVADGVPDRVDRLHALGNALVPQIAEWIGRRIMTYEASTPAEVAA